MSIWALSDLHLPLGAPDKNMEVFGECWKNYVARIELHWKSRVQSDDLVLIAGDISWSLQLEKALIDLNWIHRLPGHKIILKGNHDLW